MNAIGRQNCNYITVFDGTNPPSIICLDQLGKDQVFFGRSRENDIALHSGLASKEHGRFVRSNGVWSIEDKAVYKGVESTNGLIKNDKYVTSSPLYAGECVRIDDEDCPVPEGVLFFFSSDEKAAKWDALPIAGSESRIELSRYLPGADAIIECCNGTARLIGGTDMPVYLNNKPVHSPTELSEKALIGCAEGSLLFSSSSLYLNRALRAGARAGVRNAVPRAAAEEGGGRRASEGVTVPVRAPEYSEAGGSRGNTESGGAPGAEPKKHGDFVAYLTSPAGYYVLCALLALVIWGIIALLWFSAGDIASVAVLVCSVFGWQTLNRIQPTMFIWMPLIGWLIYFIVKFVLSAMIGFFVAPFRIAKWVAAIITSNQ